MLPHALRANSRNFTTQIHKQTHTPAAMCATTATAAAASAGFGCCWYCWYCCCCGCCYCGCCCLMYQNSDLFTKHGAVWVFNSRKNIQVLVSNNKCTHTNKQTNKRTNFLFLRPPYFVCVPRMYDLCALAGIRSSLRENKWRVRKYRVIH